MTRDTSGTRSVMLFGRELEPVRLPEFTARALARALEFELARLQVVVSEARDRADRRGWALAKLTGQELSKLKRDLEAHLEDLGPTPEEDLQELEELLQRRGRDLPRSKANAELLNRKGPATT